MGMTQGVLGCSAHVVSCGAVRRDGGRESPRALPNRWFLGKVAVTKAGARQRFLWCSVARATEWLEQKRARARRSWSAVHCRVLAHIIWSQHGKVCVVPRCFVPVSLWQVGCSCSER